MVQPLELVLRGAPARGVRRAILAAHGEAWLRLDGEPTAAPGWHDVDGAELAIAEVKDDRVRVLHEADDVRMLVWVSRGDLAPVIVREAVVAPGVVLAPGTAIVEEGRDGDRVRVRVAADGLVVTGSVEAAAIGEMWDARAPRQARVTHVLAEQTPIRAAAGEAGEVVATTTRSIEVRAIGPARAGWREIETAGEHVHARGFVREDSLDAEARVGETGFGSGYGSSHAITLDVPAGTCLYDDVEGDVIGIVVEDRARLAYATERPGWFTLLVNSPWGLLDVPAHDEGEGRWARCAD